MFWGHDHRSSKLHPAIPLLLSASSLYRHCSMPREVVTAPGTDDSDCLQSAATVHLDCRHGPPAQEGGVNRFVRPPEGGCLQKVPLRRGIFRAASTATIVTRWHRACR